MRHDVAGMIDEEDGAAADASVLQAAQDRVERNDSGQHACEVIVDVFQRNRDNKRRTIVRSKGKRIATEAHDAELLRLQAGDKGALKRFGYEGILLRAKVPLRGAGALAGFADGSEVDECVAIAVEKILEKTRDLRLSDGIFDIFDEAGQG